MVSNTESNDSSHSTDLIDGLSIQLEPAPTVRRIAAYFIDLSVISAIMYAIFIVLSIFAVVISFWFVLPMESHMDLSPVLGRSFIVLLLSFLLILLCFYHGYFIFFESKRGYTPGKKAFGLRVVAEDGAKATIGQCVLRDLLRYVDLGMLFPGLVCISLSAKRQRLGDLAAQTRVIYARHEEENVIALFMSYERYAPLLASWAEHPIPRSFARQLLSYASNKLILGELGWADERTDQPWIADFETATGQQRPVTVDDGECLRFLAELCNRRLAAAQRGSEFI